ncbi:MAG: four helix bundle protein [Gammaproteobacteria bacterium]|nr:four helix bundle protein [Gammaproteobacteria bacterium]MCP5201457.1 four helix bundle protein [Gammaproteobacteria bacterium]
MDALQGLQAWTRACGLASDTYRAMGACSDRVFREQVTRASLAVAASIAEGYERGSRPQFAQYLRSARGSCAELRTQLYIAADIGLVENDTAHRLVAELLELSKTLQTLINRCERRR